MIKETYHPNAYLADFRNVKPGLQARTLILYVLEGISTDARAIARQTGLSYSVVLYHVRLLEAKGIVNRRGSRPFIWTLTGVGQMRLLCR